MAFYASGQSRQAVNLFFRVRGFESLRRYRGGYMKILFKVIMTVTYFFSRPKNGTVNNKKMRVIDNVEHIISYAKDLSKQWHYLYDKWYGLLNHINVPTQAVFEKSGDCDDFASHIYQVSQNFDPYLLTYFPKQLRKAHTVTVLNLGPQYLLINWGRISYHESIQSVYENLEKYAGSKLISKHWAKYNYDSGKFYSIKESHIA